MSQVIAVGTAVPATVYSQEEVLNTFGIHDRRIRSIFLGGGIETRHLELSGDTQAMGHESQKELLRKHVSCGLTLGQGAIEACLSRANATIRDVRYLCCVSSTGFIVPGFTALLIKKLGISVLMFSARCCRDGM